MKIAGIYWSRILGPIVGMAGALLVFRALENRWGLVLALGVFLALSWWGERRWWRQADAEEQRLTIEDRMRNPPE